MSKHYWRVPRHLFTVRPLTPCGTGSLVIYGSALVVVFFFIVGATVNPQPAFSRCIHCWRNIATLLGLVMLVGCSTFVSNEKRGPDPSTPVSSVSIVFVENPALKGTYETLVKKGFEVDWSKQEAQAQRDVPVMLSHVRKGLATDLKPRLERRRLSVAIEAPAQPTSTSLIITPKRYFVECGKASIICQTSITFDVRLIDPKLSTPVWSADFKAGALLGMEQTPAMADDFYRAVVERLVAAKVIP
ncbi:hypothetical protein ACEN8I_16065 [Polaromonas sp. CT11-55]|uniref:hypothetical protein n=1 Tax=Polaromonas sp. CT11-55 TaxID=3243045 RepID=UPI0039A5D6AB